MANPLLPAIEALFWPQGIARGMWMIVDGARNRSIYSFLNGSALEYSCLFAGNLAPDLKQAAPYLVGLDFAIRHSRVLIDEAWGRSWGVFLRSKETGESLRRHLRQFLKVRDMQGHSLLFRYYDPRVLRPYLPTCNSEELRNLFGPIECFYMEDEDATVALECRLERGTLSTRKVALAADAARV